MQKLSESHALTSTDMESPVPVIDLNDKNALELIGHACKNWGVFQVVNHNIKKNAIDNMVTALKDLFALPMEQKLKAERSLKIGGGYGAPPISLFRHDFAKPEGFTILGSPLEHARLLWPNDYQKFCDVVEEYKREMNSLSVSLLWMMLGSLEIAKDDVKWGGQKGDFEGGYSVLQLNSYQPCPDLERTCGLVGHTDSSLFTILHQNTSKFQVEREGLGWITIPPIEDALVVVIGDLLQILSNGLFTSAFHRALANPTQHRISIAYFYGPPSDVKVSPLPKLLDNFHPPLYTPVTWTEYRGIKYKYFDNALSAIRVCAKLDEDCDASNTTHGAQGDESTTSM